MMRYFLLLLYVGLLSGCALLDKDGTAASLKGERLPILTTEGMGLAAHTERTPMQLPAAETAHNWPYSTLVPTALPENIRVMRTVQGKPVPLSSRTQLYAGPVVLDGRAYIANCDGELFYNNLEENMKRPARMDLGYGSKKKRDCFNTGITAHGTYLYITKGDQSLTAVDTTNESLLWHYEAPSALHVPVTFSQGYLALLTEDNTLQVIDAATAQPKWQEKMAMEEVGIVGQALPVAAYGNVYVIYNTGLMVAYRLDTGDIVWTANLAYAQFGKTSFNFNDSNATPIIRDGVAYVADNSGALFAIGAEDGALLWHVSVELPQALWVAGNRVFVRNLEHKVYAFDRRTGAKQWELDLLKDPVFAPKGKKKKVTQFLTHGPLLLNSQLVVTTSTGHLLQIDPAEGKILQNSTIPASNAAPILWNDQLYIWDVRGKLVPVELPA